MPLVLTSCTNRKRLAPNGKLIAGSLPLGSLTSVAASWRNRLRSANHRVPAEELYCGRAFREAEAAAHQARAGFFVVSAGLGLVPASTLVPSYSLTITPGSPDNVFSRIIALQEPAQWWGELARSSPYGISLANAFGRHKGLIMIALPAAYLDMIAGELLALPRSTHSRFRIFTLSPPSSVPQCLRPYILPYDSRFDGADAPVPGTRSDFAQRSLAHFVSTVLPLLPRGDVQDHAEAVERLLSGLRRQQTPVRLKRSDAEIRTLSIAIGTRLTAGRVACCNSCATSFVSHASKAVSAPCS